MPAKPKKSSDKSKLAPAPTNAKNTLRMFSSDRKSRERLLAELGLTTVTPNAAVVRDFAKPVIGDLDITEVIGVMTEKAAAVQRGDLSGLEATLTSQVTTLDTIFAQLARRAAANMGEHLNATEVYLRLALKAQAQCRATVQTLAEIKNPSSVAFVRQANIANGPQQVNNEAPPDRVPASRTRKFRQSDQTN